MSDIEPTDNEPVEGIDDELPDHLGDEEFDPDDVEDDEGSNELGDSDAKEDDEDDEADEAGPRPAGSGDDDEDEPDPGDVEADLDEILRDRIAAGDDEDDEEEEMAVPASVSDDVEGRRESEIHCPNCFLLVVTDTVNETGECPHCGGPIP